MRRRSMVWKMRFAVALACIACVAPSCFPEEGPNLRTYFRDYIGLSDSQIAAIRNGQAFAKTLHSRTPAEIFVFGAVHIDVAPDKYLEFA